MKRIYLFFYYCYALQWPVDDTYIFSFSLAWELAGIASRDERKWLNRNRAKGKP